MQPVLLKRLENVLGFSIQQVHHVPGGDVSLAYLIVSSKGQLFCKVNNGIKAQQMFCAEREGLAAMAGTQTIKTPTVYYQGMVDGASVMVMQYIQSRTPTSEDHELLGRQLAQMHLQKLSDTFGWPTDNYIGHLPQLNKPYGNWVEFYVETRLLPQLRLAVNTNCLSLAEIPHEDTLAKVLENLFPVVEPSLLHGDLWSGNYLIDQQGNPYLIDPAVYFGHSEIDLAMTKLFGGFDRSFYGAYHEMVKEIPGARHRESIYQLYYLLVHLNMFGKTYYTKVKSILGQYF